jgi:23S rRNA pseudouridine2457 synthase
MNEESRRYFIINKPFNMVSQFKSSHQVGLLGDLDFSFPEGTHAVGRLDNHSEGLLILTTNKKVTRLLFQGEKPHTRTYLVQVKNVVSEESLHRLRTGVCFRIRENEYHTTAPCDISIVEKPGNLFKREVELLDYPPYTWLRISLTEGKFHQVRKMVSAIRHKCIRLIRVSIEDLCLGDLQPGKVKEIKEKDFFELLKIENWSV